MRSGESVAPRLYADNGLPLGNMPLMRCRRSDAPRPHADNGLPLGHMPTMRCHDNVMSITNPTNPIPSLSEAFPSPYLSLLRSYIPAGTSISSHSAVIHDPGQRLHFSTGSTEQDMKSSDVNISLLKTQQSHPSSGNNNTNNNNNNSSSINPAFSSPFRPTLSARANTNPTLGSIHKMKSRPSPSSPSQSTYRLPSNTPPNAQAPTHKLSELPLLQVGPINLSHTQDKYQIIQISSYFNTATPESKPATQSTQQTQQTSITQYMRPAAPNCPYSLDSPSSSPSIYWSSYFVDAGHQSSRVRLPSNYFSYITS